MYISKKFEFQAQCFLRSHIFFQVNLVFDALFFISRPSAGCLVAGCGLQMPG
jgi:hypothetical protein